MMALGLFLMMSFGLITVLGSTKGKKHEKRETVYGENPDHIETSRYFMKRFDEDTLSKGPMTETLGKLYGHRKGDTYEALDFKNYKGKTERLGPGKGAAFKPDYSSISGTPPKGMEDIGYVHRHRDMVTPKGKLPDELKNQWDNSSNAEKILFPSKEDLSHLEPGEVMMIASPRGDYRPWAIDEYGHPYSPGFAVKRKE
jgi:hypothetical protein